MGTRTGTKLPARTYLPIWEEAAKEEIGIRVDFRGGARVRALLVNALYECRKQTGGFEDLIIFQVGEDFIFIAHETVELPE